jgi:hypothetical protein
MCTDDSSTILTHPAVRIDGILKLNVREQEGEFVMRKLAKVDAELGNSLRGL